MSLIIKLILAINFFILVCANNQSNETLNCYYNSLLSNNLEKNYKLNEIIDDGPLKRAAGELKEEFIKFIGSMYDYETDVDDYLYDLIEFIDQECFDFLLKLFFNETDFMTDISKRLLGSGGLIQNSIGTEEDCLDDDGVYILFTGENNRSELRKEKTYKSKELLFRESNYVRQEICIFKECRHFYKPFIEYLVNYQLETIKKVFHWNNFKITGINYNDINDDETIQKTKEQQERELTEKNYFYIILIILAIFIIILFIFSIISWIIEASPENSQQSDNKSTAPKSKSIRNDSDEKHSNLIINEEEEGSVGGRSNSTISTIKTKKNTDLELYKVISSFDFIKNFSYLNEDKESLFDQKNIIELSTIKLFTLFFIMLGENSYIILKYVENKMSILSFCKNFFFFFIKLGTNSYESYKVICGVLFGYKFISYYYKYKEKEKSMRKKILIFATKPFPYIIMFVIIHFILNYPIFIYVRNLFGNIKNTYLSSIMEQYSCQKDVFHIFNFISIMGEYNSTEFNIGQFNGCSRPILFVFSELFCFYLVLIIAVINVYFYHEKITKIFSLIFFILNIASLALTYFITREVNDLTDEYTVSRLFGLSGSIAMPYLFLPLYYIGFNIGIIYYYRVKYNSGEEDNNIPFKYCYYTSNKLLNINGKLKNIIIFTLIFLIFLLSFSYYLLVNVIGDGEFFFTFDERPLSKYIFIYKGIIHGLLFSAFILVYVCLQDDAFLKKILSSEFFNFTHKISFTLFVSFIPVLYFFHSIGIMEIYLLHFSVFSNTVILFIISLLLSIFITCIIFFPIKKIYLYITKGFDNKDFKNDDKLKAK